MPGGFHAVPEELRQTADRIGESIAGVGELSWTKPSGDYGHPGAQARWQHFLGAMEDRIFTLRTTADEHGANLRTQAGLYVDADSSSASAIGNCFGDGDPGRAREDHDIESALGIGNCFGNGEVR